MLFGNDYYYFLFHALPLFPSKKEYHRDQGFFRALATINLSLTSYVPSCLSLSFYSSCSRSFSSRSDYIIVEDLIKEFKISLIVSLIKKLKVYLNRIRSSFDKGRTWILSPSYLSVYPSSLSYLFI